MSIWVALVLLTLCAILWDAGIVLQKLAVDALPPVRLDRGLGRSIRGLLGSGRWMAGLGASAAGWGLFAWALTFTPVSVARAIQGSGFVILAVFSLLFLRHRLTLLEWIGVVLVTAGIAALGIAQGAGAGAPDRVQVGRLLLAAGVCVAVALLAAGAHRIQRPRLPAVVLVAVTAGCLLGLGDVATKLLLETLARSGVGLAAGGVALALVATYLSGFLVLSRAYQQGRAIVATAVSDLCARLVAIFLGTLGLGEALAASASLRPLAVVGYVAILGGAALLSRFGGGQLAADLSHATGQAAKVEAAPGTQVDTED